MTGKRKVFNLCFVLWMIVALTTGVLADDKPNMLIIGDPIATGYADHLAGMMSGNVNVFKIDGNSLATRVGIKEGTIEGYLNAEYDGKIRKWDAVVVHYGFWDIGRVPGAGGPRTSLQTYGVRLAEIGDKLKKLAPDAKVIWSNIPALPEGDTEFHHDEDPGLYNEVAKKVMDRLNIPVCDVYTMTCTFDPGLREEKNRTIFNSKGYEKIAGMVQVRIEEILGVSKKPASAPIAGMEVGVKRKTGLYACENNLKLLGYLTPGMMVKVLEEDSTTRVKVSFESGGKVYEGVCKRTDLNL